jgi:hypothetical protein
MRKNEWDYALFTFGTKLQIVELNFVHDISPAKI